MIFFKWGGCTGTREPRGTTPRSRSGGVAALCWSSCEEIPHVQGKRNPSKLILYLVRPILSSKKQTRGSVSVESGTIQPRLRGATLDVVSGSIHASHALPTGQRPVLRLAALCSRSPAPALTLARWLLHMPDKVRTAASISSGLFVSKSCISRATPLFWKILSAPASSRLRTMRLLAAWRCKGNNKGQEGSLATEALTMSEVQGLGRGPGLQNFFIFFCPITLLLGM